MEKSLVIIKPSGIKRNIIGQIIERFERKGLTIAGLKMMQLDEKILREHYAHLIDRPFFPSIVDSMMSTPVVVICLTGADVVAMVRLMVGVTDSRVAAPGTIRGDFGLNAQENIVHASDSPENGDIEVARFFKPDEIFAKM